MCGIIGIITKDKRDISGEIIGALSRLEYRGYDSAGLALTDGETVSILKCVGAPSQHLHAKDIQNGRVVQSLVGIGHNRWATHGKPTLSNAHPHTDKDDRVVVVHNGTILNYESLKKFLGKHGVVFRSETDTEVIPHLVRFHLDQGLTIHDAFAKTVSELEGAYGIVLFDKENPNTLFVAKQGSPIVIGVADDGYYVASSIHGFLPHTTRYVTLNDGEMATLSVSPKLELIISQIKDKKVVRGREEEQAEDVVLSDLSKGEFETFMLKEIFEQPATTLATLLGRTNQKDGVAVLGGLFDAEEVLHNIKHLLFTGCGTAYFAGEVGKYLIEATTSISVRAEIASEGRYIPVHLKQEELAVFALSQSGETADTLEYIKELKRKHYATFGIVNVVGSALANTTGKGVYTKVGTEVGVASTKAFTAMLAVVYLLNLYLARTREMTKEEGRAYVAQLEKIPHAMKEVLLSSETFEKLAEKYLDATTVQFLGRGIHVPIAKEAALKFREITYREVGAYPLGELKHGPIAVIDEGTLAVVILPHDSYFELGINSIEQIKAKSGKVLLITDASVKDHPICQKVDDVFFLPHLDDPLFYPFIEMLPLQLFAYYTAKKLGRNIDKPRNLAKSVTVV